MKKLLETIFWIFAAIVLFCFFALVSHVKTDRCKELNPNSEYSEVLKICTLKN